MSLPESKQHPNL